MLCSLPPPASWVAPFGRPSGMGTNGFVLTMHGPVMCVLFVLPQTLTVSPNIDGTTENVPCSNRGICEEETGECQCFTQYGSSNGLGAPGTRPDCGAVMPYLPVPGQVIDYTHWRTRQSELLYNERQQMQGQKRNDDDDDFFGGK